MGWISYHVEPINGKIDRKGEMDSRWRQEEDTDKDGTHYPKLEVLKSSVVGSTYYGAIKSTKDGVSNVFAVICLTSIDNKEYFNFAVKDMNEFCGPYQNKCPIGILKLLSETENEWANNWRKSCYKYHNKRKDKNSLHNLPIGTKIKALVPYDTTAANKGEEVIFIKCKGYTKKSHSYWYGRGYRWKESQIGDNYEVIKEN